MMENSPQAIYADIGANLAVAGCKFAAGFATGSSAMFAEGVHSVVDSCDGLLLLLGPRRSRKPPSPDRPLGHGREVYFWSFVVAVIFFALGAVVALAQGLHQTLNPTAMSHSSGAMSCSVHPPCSKERPSSRGIGKSTLALTENRRGA